MLHSTPPKVTFVCRTSCFLLLASTAVPAWAESAQTSEQTEFIIIGTRLRDVVPVRSLTKDEIAAYGLSTIEDLIDEVRAESGDDDDDPVFLINGERVEDLDDVAGFPVEALERVEVLPRGSGTRVGASATRRVYNLTLKKQVRTATVVVAPRIATEGDWGAVRGEMILTRIKGPDRINLSLRAREDGLLLESDRGIVQPEQRLPFDLRGNVIAGSLGLSDEVDPRLSARAGSRVTIAGVPAGSAPTLADFSGRANTANLTDLGRFRSLRGATRGYDINFSHGTRLAPWLTSSVSARLNYSESSSLSGLASGIFILTPENAFSPFSETVAIAAFGEPRGLEQRFRTIRGSLNVNLNANHAGWRFNLAATHDEGSSRFASERQSAISLSPILLDNSRNPFSSTLADLLPLTTDRSLSLPSRSNLRFTGTSSPITLPAGPIQLTTELRATLNSLESRANFFGEETSRSFRRTEFAGRGAVDLPLASRRNGFLPALGDLSANLDYALIDVSEGGTASELTYGFVWSPKDWIQLNGSINDVRTPPGLELIGDPLSITPGVRIFDPLRGGTVDVTLISGGNQFLLPERVRTERIAVNLRPLQSISLQVNAEYTGIRISDSVSSLPLDSASIFLAFPERFVRDANGFLTTVDNRPVNFERQSRDQVRYGFSFSLPLGQGSVGAPGAGSGAVSTSASSDDGEGDALPPPSGPRPRLQVTANHTMVLENEILVREGLEPIDLLTGGAVGFAGGRPRHQVDATLGLSSRGTGVRLTGTWRSESSLEIRSDGITDTLRFSPLATVNLRAFSEASRLFPQVQWVKATRFSVAVTNLLNQRQQVEDSFGNTPLRFQPGYRDALGRTIEFEIRKVF